MIKNKYLVLSLVTQIVLSFNAKADNLCGENCTYSKIENGVDAKGNPTYTLKIEPIDSTKPASIKDYERKGYENKETYEWYLGTHEVAPWASDTSITKLEISEGVVSVGRHAFTNMNSVTEVKFNDGLKTISEVAFYQTNIKKFDFPDSLETIKNYAIAIGAEEINMPESMTRIGNKAFSRINVENFVVPSGVNEISVLAFGDGSWDHSEIKNIYCPRQLSGQCAAAVAVHGDENGVNVVDYEIENGLYKFEDNYYAFADDMVKKTNPCENIENCQKQLLEAKGVCKSSDCTTLVKSANAGQLLKVGSKTYQSLNALITGNFDVRRIYTVDEANFVAGEKNRVSIKYR
ncbi:MAG: leucine-rich repeat domain-containing protein [Alphaproteobacteria bacterium]|nr:leucine-rich repeat domain-containing protein [Alphaproteobacteria bacterium]